MVLGGNRLTRFILRIFRVPAMESRMRGGIPGGGRFAHAFKIGPTAEGMTSSLMLSSIFHDCGDVFVPDGKSNSFNCSTGVKSAVVIDPLGGIDKTAIHTISNHVASLDAKWLIRPHGTIFTAGRLARIWVSAGGCRERVVRVGGVHYLSIDPDNPEQFMLDGSPVSIDVIGQMILDSDFSMQDILDRLFCNGIYSDEPAECPVLSFVPYEGHGSPKS